MGGLTMILLALSFLLELCLLAAMAVIGWSAFDGAVVKVLAAVALATAVGALWGVLLSPNRRVDLPLAVRVTIELVLFVAAAAGLAFSGWAIAGAALLVGEVVVLVALAMRGQPPGSHPAMHRPSSGS